MAPRYSNLPADMAELLSLYCELLEHSPTKDPTGVSILAVALFNHRQAEAEHPAA